MKERKNPLVRQVTSSVGGQPGVGQGFQQNASDPRTSSCLLHRHKEGLLPSRSFHARALEDSHWPTLSHARPTASLCGLGTMLGGGKALGLMPTAGARVESALCQNQQTKGEGGTRNPRTPEPEDNGSTHTPLLDSTSAVSYRGQAAFKPAILLLQLPNQRLLSEPGVSRSLVSCSRN